MMNAENQDFDAINEMWGTPLSHLPNPNGSKKYKIINYLKWGLVAATGISATIIAIKLSIKKQIRTIQAENEVLKKQLEEKSKELEKMKEQSKDGK